MSLVSDLRACPDCSDRRARRRARPRWLRAQGRARSAVRERPWTPNVVVGGAPAGPPPPIRPPAPHAHRLAHRLSPATVSPCIISPIATACCTPRRSISSSSPQRSGPRSTATRPRRCERHYEVFAEAFADVKALVCYAMKANSNQAVVKTLAELGAGADVVSGGELRRARAAGVPPDKIMFSGIGKTARELALAVDEGILCVNVESDAELELLSSIAAGKGRTARISVRVNPDIDARTHAKIATGKAENKFGIPISRAREVYARAAKLPGLAGDRRRHAYRQPDHRARPLRRCLRAAVRFRAMPCGRTATHQPCRSRRRARHPLSRRQRAAAASRRLCDIVKRATRDLGCTLIFEPGRLIVGNAGILVTRVLYLKRGEAKIFVVVDAGMNDLIRPTLYDAHHEIRPVREPPPGARRDRRRRGRAGLRIRGFPGPRSRHGQSRVRAI